MVFIITPYAIIHDSYTIQFIYDIKSSQIIDCGIHDQYICNNSRFIYETIHIQYNLYTNSRL